jgi:hypothetical protein
MTPLEMHKKMFPNVMLNFFQMDLIEAEIQDADAWKETLYFWAGNDYRGQSVFKMIELYKQKLEDRSKGRWQDVGRADNINTDYKCRTCFDLKMVSKPDPNGQWSFSTMEVECPDCVLQTA